MNLSKLKVFEEILKYVLNVNCDLHTLLGSGDLAMVNADKDFGSGHYFVIKAMLLGPSKKLNKTTLALFLNTV